MNKKAFSVAVASVAVAGTIAAPAMADETAVTPVEQAQQAVVQAGVGGGTVAAAVHAGVADGQHHVDAVQFPVISLNMQVMPEAAADGFEDGQGVRGGPAAQRDAPPLGDTVGHLGVDACGVDIDAVALGRCQQIHREGFGCQLGIHIQEIRRGAEVAHIVVPAAAGHTADRYIRAACRALNQPVPRSGVLPAL